MMITHVDEPSISAKLDAKIRRALGECFPRDAAHFSAGRDWHGSWPAFSVIATDEHGDVVGQIGVVDRVVTVGGAPLRVAGFQNVCVVPAHRKTGLFDRLMRATLDESIRRRFDMGLLFCREPLRKVYARFGWQDVSDRPVTRVDGGAEVPLPSHAGAMVYPMVVKTLPEGTFHLRGNDW
jgi:predicted N-acetyltransferase YhbS